MKLFILKTIWLIQKTRDYCLMPILSKNSFLSAVYFFFFNFSFYREFHAVLSARVDYNRKIKGENVSEVLLRRNTHKLEKGLIMMQKKNLTRSARSHL